MLKRGFLVASNTLKIELVKSYTIKAKWKNLGIYKKII